MDFVEFANNVFDVANDALDIGFLWGGFALLLAYPLYLYFSNLKKAVKEKKGSDLISQTLIAYVMVFIGLLIWFFPEAIWLFIIWFFALPKSYFNSWGDWVWLISVWRLLLVFGLFTYFSYYLGHEYGQERWKQSTIGFLLVISVGFLINRWMGVLFVSVPFLVVYYAILRDLALVIVPASKPEDKTEQKKRVDVFKAYTWGTQAPIYVVEDHAWTKQTPRINGDVTWEFSDFPIPGFGKLLQRPGLIWTRSHQAVAISGGNTFKRIEGPGISFFGKLERLDQVFDLRNQLRTREIEVVSKDGVHFIARYFTAFRIDNTVWNRELYHTLLHRNEQLHHGDKLMHTDGSFPFSPVRIQATLGVTGTKTGDSDVLVYWDQWAMNVVEDQVRKVISQKNLNELWRPIQDKKFENALEVIAREVFEHTHTTLRAEGLILFTARVVNFRFPLREGAKDGELDDISKQQIATWSSEWNRRRIEILSEAHAEAERAQQEARAYAESLLLNAIAEGLQKTHEINPRLPRYVIAMRFLSALQDYIHKRPESGTEDEEIQKKLANLEDELQQLHNDFLEE